jgi:hypothetical protein
VVNMGKNDFTICESEACESVSKSARESVSGMSSSELLRFGVKTKFRYSQAESPDDPRMKALLAQLNHARAEWNRRHPDLPLRDSF